MRRYNQEKSQLSRMELGCVSALDCDGRTIWIADAHRGDGKRFVVRADEKLIMFKELKSACLVGKMKAVFIMLIACVASVALAEDFKTVNGKEYKNVTVSRVETDGIVVKTKAGISKIYFAELPKDVQERFHYDAPKAVS